MYGVNGRSDRFVGNNVRKDQRNVLGLDLRCQPSLGLVIFYRNSGNYTILATCFIRKFELGILILVCCLFLNLA